LKKCNNETLEEGEYECAPIEIIDKYIEDLSVDTWVLHENIDFDIYGEKPVFSIMRFLSSDMVDVEYVNTEYVFMR
jgi:hypothetical protein